MTADRDRAAGRRCLVCCQALRWPAIHFCGPACSEAWIRRHREEERGAGPEPVKRARGGAR